LEAGYEQVSMRMFRLPPRELGTAAPIYRCQEDGMVGIGVGARSYTQSLHYCTEYAVGRKSVLGILEDYVARDSDSFSFADFGIELDLNEQMRRYFSLSLLSYEGFCEANFLERFDCDFPFNEEVNILEEGSWVCRTGDGRLRLTATGMALSDTIGPWLFSENVQKRVAEYELE
jgi:oxygen-independent coproporphyrinogen-3 oxidase